MTNKQPFYHRVDGVLFTATREVSKAEFEKALRKALREVKGVVASHTTVEIYHEAEAGDPADLL